MIWISRLKSAEEASINVSFNCGTSKSYSGEFLNSSVDLCARGLLERVQQDSNAALTSVSLYTHCRHFSRLLIEVNRVIVSSFLPGLTLRSTSTSALALSVWKRSSHADEFHELASHVLYCTPLNFINCETERCLLHASLQKNVVNWNWSVNDLVATFEGGKGERGVCMWGRGGSDYLPPGIL